MKAMLGGKCTVGKTLKSVTLLYAESLKKKKKRAN